MCSIGAKSMNKTRHSLHDRCRNDLKAALKRFGTRTFDDKGAFEVICIPSILTEFYALPHDVAADVLHAMYTDPISDGRMKDLVGTLLVEMQSWDELFNNPKIDKIEW
jgi:hypothetical protein